MIPTVDSALVRACAPGLLKEESKPALRQAMRLLERELKRRANGVGATGQFVPANVPQMVAIPAPVGQIKGMLRAMNEAAKNPVRRTSLLAAACICKLNRGLCEGMCGRGGVD